MMPQNSASLLRISFSLTRLQRIFNPVEGVVYSLAGIGILLGGVFGIVIDPTAWQPWVITVVSSAFAFLLFGKPLLSLYQRITSGKYINTMEIENDSVRIGIDKLQLEFPRQILKVRKGFLGTIVIRHPYGYSIVLPKKVVGFRELKALIERKNHV